MGHACMRQLYCTFSNLQAHLLSRWNVVCIPRLLSSTSFRVAASRLCNFCGGCQQNILGTEFNQLNRRSCLALGNVTVSAGYCSSSVPPTSPDTISERDYEQLAENTLHSLADVFDGLVDLQSCSSAYDVSCSNSVLTVQLGEALGTYVINKQTPNQQIWLSSPFSGPKRYDLVHGMWVYLHDKVALHDLLTKEISAAFKTNVKFPKQPPE